MTLFPFRWCKWCGGFFRCWPWRRVKRCGRQRMVIYRSWGGVDMAGPACVGNRVRNDSRPIIRVWDNGRELTAEEAHKFEQVGL